MPNRCEKCGKEFYSDTEYGNHLDKHEFKDFYADLIKQQGENISWFAQEVRRVGLELRILVAHQIARGEGVSIKEALSRHGEYWNAIQELARNADNSPTP